MKKIILILTCGLNILTSTTMNLHTLTISQIDNYTNYSFKLIEPFTLYPEPMINVVPASKSNILQFYIPIQKKLENGKFIEHAEVILKNMNISNESYYVEFSSTSHNDKSKATASVYLSDSQKNVLAHDEIDFTRYASKKAFFVISLILEGDDLENSRIELLPMFEE